MRVGLTLLLLSSLQGLAVPKKKAAKEVLLDFEGDGFQTWQTKGEAFGVGPTTSLPETIGGTVLGFSEETFASSAQGGIQAQGTLTSPPFILNYNYLSFKAGGLKTAKTKVELKVAGEVVHTLVPSEDLALQQISWEVTPWIGQQATLHLTDESAEGFLIVDHFVAHTRINPSFPPPTQDGVFFAPGLTNSPLLPGLQIPEGFNASIFADHKTHSVSSPTALTVADDGSLYLSETYRFRFGVADNRDHLYWILDDIASTTTDDRRALHDKWQHQLPIDTLTARSEAVRRLQDIDNDGRADESSVFAAGFNDVLDGTAAGVFAYEGIVYFSCIPNIWALSDFDGDGSVSEEERIVLQDGFGVRVSISGHDLNGFALGPDGRLYGTIGDRAMNLTTAEGKHYPLTDQGAVFRFEPDGSDFEIIHTGLRNPKEIAFNEVGDAFTMDNNADIGDQARLVYVVDGGDSGWRTDHQTLGTFFREIGLTERPLNRWTDDEMWRPANSSQPAWMLPPLYNFTSGPSGFAFQPGTALGGSFRDHFFICDYKGGPAASGVHAFTVEQTGASYQLDRQRKLLWGLAATDIDFGFQGTAYLTDYVGGWVSAKQGQVVALNPPSPHPAAQEVAQLVAEGFRHRTTNELKDLIAHPDQRVRLRAQFALTEKEDALTAFYSQLHLRNEILDLAPENLLLPPLEVDDEFREQTTPLARLHATWGLAMLARKEKNLYATAALLGLLQGDDAELRAQAAKALGEAPVQDASRLITALSDSSERVRFFAALSLGRLKVKEAFEPLLKLAITASDQNDPYLRHAAVVGLAGCASEQELLTLSGHALPGARLPSLLALYRRQHTGVSRFLFDHTPAIRHEAIRTIHDTPIESARPALLEVVDELLTKTGSSVMPPFIWRRLIHSTFRLGESKNAARLLQIAKSARVPLTERKEALRLLHQWTEPYAVDQSLGRHAPLTPRPFDEINTLLENELPSLLLPESPLLQEAIALIAHYQLIPPSLDDVRLLTLVDEESILPEARRLALTMLADRSKFKITPILVKLLDASKTPAALKLEALTQLTKQDPNHSFSYLSRTLHSDDPAVRQGVALQLASHPHPEVPLILVSYFDRLREGEEADRSIELEMTLAARISSHHAAHEALKAYEETLGDDPLAAHLPSLHGGNAKRGAELFANHPTAQCSRCHSVNPKRSHLQLAGPHLAGTGKQTRRELLEALIDPSATLAPGFGFITITKKDGETISGSFLDKAPTSIHLLVNEKEMKIQLADIETQSEPVSPMPPMAQLLSGEEIRDLIAYLKTFQ